MHSQNLREEIIMNYRQVVFLCLFMTYEETYGFLQSRESRAFFRKSLSGKYNDKLNLYIKNTRVIVT